MQQIHSRELEQVQASPYAEEHQLITHCVFHPSLCILSILTEIGKADSADGIRTTTSSVPLSRAIHILRFSLDINFIQEQKLQNKNYFKRLIVSIYSRLVVFTNINAKGCYRMNKELEQKDLEQQLQAPHSEQQLQASTQASHQFTPCALHRFLWKMGKNIIHSEDSGITTTSSAALPVQRPRVGLCVCGNGCRPKSS